MALARNEPAREILEQARELARTLDPNTRFYRAVARLERAFEAHEAGGALVRGECVEDLPEGLRRRMADPG